MNNARLLGLVTTLAMFGVLLLVPSSSQADWYYCNELTPPNSPCRYHGVADFNQYNVNRAHYPGSPGISVCQRTTNWADSITVSRRCGNPTIYSYYDIVEWVQCRGGSPNDLHFRAGNDSNYTHTIHGSAYHTTAMCV